MAFQRRGFDRKVQVARIHLIENRRPEHLPLEATEAQVGCPGFQTLAARIAAQYPMGGEE